MSSSAVQDGRPGMACFWLICVALCMTLVAGCGTNGSTNGNASAGATAWTQRASGGDDVSLGVSGLSLVVPTYANAEVIKRHQQDGRLWPDQVAISARIPPRWLACAEMLSFAHLGDWPLARSLTSSQVIARSTDGSVAIYWDAKGGLYKPFLIPTHLRGKAYGAILESQTFPTPTAAWNEANLIWQGLGIQGATLPPLDAASPE